MVKKLIWLIGTGPMAVEYARVLKAMETDFKVIGRGMENIRSFKDKTGLDALPGGIDHVIKTTEKVPDYAIVAVGVEALAGVTISLIRFGVKKILCEKPGGLNGDQILNVADLARRQHADVLLAYNRRFYQSVNLAREMIMDDGGVLSFCFDFSENSSKIETIQKAPGVKENWFLANSTHVVDLAFFLGGEPKSMNCLVQGELSWHKPAIFIGSGISEEGALFSYHANWMGPGRWGLELITPKRKLVLRPMEKLQIQQRDSFELEYAYTDNNVDENFKAGVYEEVVAFLQHDDQRFMSVHQQVTRLNIYQKMLGINA